MKLSQLGSPGNLTQNYSLNCDSPWQEAVERDELFFPDGPDVVLEGLLQLVQLIAQLVGSSRVVPVMK